MTQENTLQNKIDLYFAYFSNKNLEPLINLFADDILLRDWEIKELGKNNVKKAFTNIFNNVDKIEVNCINTSIIGLRAYCEIEIIVNSNQILKVVDIIDFDKDNLIYSIKAFKG